MRLALLLAVTVAVCAGAPAPVILISVDTLRADRLSCYGSRGRGTPQIDALARGGTLFSQANAQVPLTLPSHVSLLTSTYPFSNGVEDNGQPVPSDALTLASILKAHGYRTAAFAGGFVLDRRFGLDRGFDVYDSPFSLPRERETDAADLKRLGEDVVNSAAAWIGKNGSGSFFVFLHLFDLHTPENLPAAARARFPGPRYEAELAYVDEVVGRFTGFLKKLGWWDKALIVFLSDHGESLGDHGENTHGYFIYQSTLRVPLILHWPRGSAAAPARVDRPVSLMGVAPAILQFAGIAVPAAFQGISLYREWQREVPAAEEIYSESLYAQRHFGTSGLRGLRVGSYQYIQAPKPELYDLARDPEEKQNLASAQPALLAAHRKRLETLRARFRPARKPAASEPAPQVAASLRSLGYLAGSSATAGGSDRGVDPKDRLADYADYRRAITLESQGHLSESNTLLTAILARQPNLVEARSLLASNQQRLGENGAAAQNFRQVLERDPGNASAHFSLAVSYSRLNQLDEAVRELRASMALAAKAGRALDQVAIPAEEALGGIWLRKNEYEKAQAQFLQLLVIAPENYEAHYNLAWLAGRAGRLNEAIFHLHAAVKADPRSAAAHNALGSIYLQQKEWERARGEFGAAVRLDPRLAYAHYNLGLVLGRSGDREGAAREFQEALKADPQLQPAREALRQMGL